MQVTDRPANDAVLWIQSAFRQFIAQPTGWIMLTAVWLLVSASVIFLPFLGIAVALLSPALFAGLMLACRDQEQGKIIGPAYLFAVFKENKSVVRALLLLGLIELVLGMLIALLFHQFGMQPLSFDMKDAADPVKARQLLIDQGGLFVLFFVLKLVVVGLFWFVTPLLVFNAMPLSHAIRWNIFGLLSNFLPVLIYGALAFVLQILASIPFALGLIVWLPVMAISNYTSYRRVFSE